MSAEQAAAHHDIAARVSSVPGLRLLVLYGSRARGDGSSLSDWDFGYLADSALDPATLLVTLVESIGSDRVDLVDLNRASGLLRYRVARDGQAVFESEKNSFANFRDQAVRFWCDAEAILRQGYDDVLTGIDS